MTLSSNILSIILNKNVLKIKMQNPSDEWYSEQPLICPIFVMMIIIVECHSDWLVLIRQSKATPAQMIPPSFDVAFFIRRCTPLLCFCCLLSETLQQPLPSQGVFSHMSHPPVSSELSKHSPLGRSIPLWSTVLSYHDLISCTLNEKEVGNCRRIM